MDLTKLFSTGSLPVMTVKERQRASILVVESETSIRTRLKQTLASLDVGHIADAPQYEAALKKIEEHQFSHVLFDATDRKMSVKEFISKALGYDRRIIAIAASYKPTVDHVFDLLMMGARGYLVKPFTTESVDEALIWATKGEPVSESVLNASSRNEALASLVMNALGKLTTVMKQSEIFDTAKREIPRRQQAMRRAVEVARMFAQGGDDALLETLVEYAAQRSEEPATRLGRVRRMLSRRGTAPEENGNEVSDNANGSTPTAPSAR